MASPWTRDGTVRAYVVTLAPEVSGQVTELAVNDNQFVHKGDLLMKLDPRDYKVAIELGKAAVDQAEADYENKKVQAERRLALTDLATSREERQTFVSSAKMASATVDQQKASLERANINLQRTEIHSPVNGWVTNLLLRQGDYATTGQQALSIVDADSFWVDGYFEETALRLIREDDPAKIWLLGYRQVLQGHVDSVARGIVVSNATPGKSGLASVDPIFTWVRLAQRVPVRVHIDKVPPDVRLVVGMTATIEVQPKSNSTPDVNLPADRKSSAPSANSPTVPRL
jgi:RND family efflux transporter MFP subunit